MLAPPHGAATASGTPSLPRAQPRGEPCTWPGDPSVALETLACLVPEVLTSRPPWFGDGKPSTGGERAGQGGGQTCTLALCYPSPLRARALTLPSGLGKGPLVSSHSVGSSHSQPRPCPPDGDTLATWGAVWTFVKGSGPPASHLLFLVLPFLHHPVSLSFCSSVSPCVCVSVSSVSVSREAPEARVGSSSLRPP